MIQRTKAILKNNKGETLIETIVSFLIMTLVLFTVSVLVMSSLHVTKSRVDDENRFSEIYSSVNKISPDAADAAALADKITDAFSITFSADILTNSSDISVTTVSESPAVPTMWVTKTDNIVFMFPSK